MGMDELSDDLLRGRSRFRAWRERRQVGERIPQRLWTLAIRLARSHGVSRTASILGLDYYQLKKRTETNVGEMPTRSPSFVELSAPVGKQCLFELDNGAGATLRVQLMGYDTTDIESLARTFGSAL
jgi:hypothetical protein